MCVPWCVGFLILQTRLSTTQAYFIVEVNSGWSGWCANVSCCMPVQSESNLAKGL